eukprot:gene34-biopygen13571
MGLSTARGAPVQHYGCALFFRNGLKDNSSDVSHRFLLPPPFFVAFPPEPIFGTPCCISAPSARRRCRSSAPSSVRSSWCAECCPAPTRRRPSAGGVVEGGEHGPGYSTSLEATPAACGVLLPRVSFASQGTPTSVAPLSSTNHSTRPPANGAAAAIPPRHSKNGTKWPHSEDLKRVPYSWVRQRLGRPGGDQDMLAPRPGHAAPVSCSPRATRALCPATRQLVTHILFCCFRATAQPTGEEEGWVPPTPRGQPCEGAARKTSPAQATRATGVNWCLCVYEPTKSGARGQQVQDNERMP